MRGSKRAGAGAPKGTEKRVQRNINMTPTAWAILDALRLPGETPDDTMQRLLLREWLMRSYHDVDVIVDGKRYKVSGNYAYELSCTKEGGWQLWWQWGNEMRQIGGEYHGGKFTIMVGDMIICGERQDETEEAPAGG
jgi:hypothetical protein